MAGQLKNNLFLTGGSVFTRKSALKNLVFLEQSELYPIEIVDYLGNNVDFATVVVESITGIKYSLIYDNSFYYSPIKEITSVSIINNISGVRQKEVGVVLSNIPTQYQILRSLSNITSTLQISRGILLVNGGLYLTGTATITEVNSGNFYSVPITNGSFPIYHSVDENLVPQQLLINVTAPNIDTSVTVTLTEPRIVPLSTSLITIMAVKRTSTIVSLSDIIYKNDFIYDGECCYSEDVFALPNGDWWQNDKSSILIKKLLSTDIIIYKLYKNDIEVTTLDTNILGEYHNFNLYTGFIIYWENVYNLYGSGKYQIKAELNFAGIETIRESQIYCLNLYSDLAADRTIRLETYQNGSIISSGYNYDELFLPRGWYQSFRLKGKFWNKKPTLEQDYLMTSDREMLQIQDKLTYEYDMGLLPIPSQVAKVIIDDNMLANEIFITDYNLYNSEIFRRVPVYVSSIEPIHYSDSRNSVYNLTFKDRFDNVLKRN